MEDPPGANSVADLRADARAGVLRGFDGGETGGRADGDAYIPRNRGDGVSLRYGVERQRSRCRPYAGCPDGAARLLPRLPHVDEGGARNRGPAAAAVE